MCKLLFMFKHDCLTKQFTPVATSLCAEDLVVLAQLDFVVVDGLA